MERNKDKVLVITAFPLNTYTAGQNYTRLILNELASRYDIELIFFSYKDHPNTPPKGIKVVREYRNDTSDRLMGMIKAPFLHPFFTSRFRWSLAGFLWKNAGNYKYIYLDFSQVFIYSLLIKHPRVIYMIHDVILQKITRQKVLFSGLNRLFIRMSESILLRRNTQKFCFSNKDVLLLKEFYDVNCKQVSFVIDKCIEEIDHSDFESKRLFCFFAAWNRPENAQGLEWFLSEVLPRLSPGIHFEVIGKGMDSQLASRIEQLGNNINYLGYLENPYERIAAADALIAPLFQGAGVKVKVLESLACGTSVIGTDIALEGIEIPEIEPYLIECNAADKFEAAINRFPAVEASDKAKLSRLFKDNYGSKLLSNYI